MPKLKAPQNAAPLYWRGKVYEIARDGSVTVPDRLASALLSHGFAPWPNPESRPAKRRE